MNPTTQNQDAESRTDQLIASVDEALEKMIRRSLKKPLTGPEQKNFDFLSGQRQIFVDQKATMIQAKAKAKKTLGRGAPNPGGEIDRSGKKRKVPRGCVDITDCDPVRFDEYIKEYALDFQQELIFHEYDQYQEIKSRKAGESDALSLRMFRRALLPHPTRPGATRPQVLISATKEQAGEVRRHMKYHVQQCFGIELIGTDKVRLWHEKYGECGVLRFMGSSVAGNQTYEGDLYFDEYWWIVGFKQIMLVAEPISSHDHWTLTMISAPSFTTHYANDVWKGPYELDEVPLNKVGKDGWYRRKVTIYDVVDAVKAKNIERKSKRLKPLVMFNLEKLKKKYKGREDDFRQLFECEIQDDTESVFPWSMIERAMVDPEDVPWLKLHDDPAWAGIDPGLTGDANSMALVAPPRGKRKEHWAYKVESKRGRNFRSVLPEQVELAKAHNVREVAVDRQGLGEGYFDQMLNHYPNAEGIYPHPETKTRLVAKALDLFERDLLKMPSNLTEFARSLTRIKRTMTEGGGYVTVRSIRKKGGKNPGHQDEAWAFLLTMNFKDWDEEEEAWEFEVC